MSIEAMKQAVEAFEHIKKYVTDDGAMPENWDAYHEKEYFALEALRQAIEQAEKQEKLCKYCGGIGRVVCDGRCMPEQEPKAWIYEGNLHIFDPTDWAIEPESVQPLYAAPPKREQEPFAPDWVNYRQGVIDGAAQREWVGLTDEEVHKIIDDCTPDEAELEELNDFAKAIFAVEAKLKEKNNG
jgi:hypothetical protein